MTELRLWPREFSDQKWSQLKYQRYLHFQNDGRRGLLRAYQKWVTISVWAIVINSISEANQYATIFVSEVQFGSSFGIKSVLEFWC